jgi:hypothetical protein
MLRQGSFSEGQCTARQGASAPERHQHEIAGVVAALDRHDADGAGHAVVSNREDAARRVFEPEPHRLGDARRDRPAGGFGVEGERAVEQIGRQIAEHEMRVGDCRLGRDTLD